MDTKCGNRGRSRWIWGVLWCVVAFFGRPLGAAEALPPAPQNHFNDYAGVVGRDAARRINDALTQFERDTSNQLVVAVFPRLPAGAAIEDYTVRVAQAWKVGQADKKNGAVLFVFTEDRKLFIQVGYGLEGVLPDARCKQIIENEIKPRFRNGDYAGGLAAGAQAMMASVRGEYRGSGRTVREARGGAAGNVAGGLFGVVVILVVVIGALVRGRRNTFYQPRGRRSVWVTPPWGGGGGNLGGGSGGGWSSGGGGGSFSGGGGSFGGGGAGGSW